MLEVKPRAYHSERQSAPPNPGQDNAKEGVSYPKRATVLVETAEAERLDMYLRSLRYVQPNSYLVSDAGGVNVGV